MKLVVAKNGINALTETNPNNFIFHSDYNTFKIIEEGTVEVTLSDTGGDEAFYGYDVTNYDLFGFGFCKFDGLDRVAPPGTSDPSSDFAFTKFIVESNSVYFFYVNDTGGDYHATFKYILTEVPIV